MCMQVRCPTCGKPTWAGCGAHIEQALASVPKAERCKCREEAAEDVTARPRRFSRASQSTPSRR